ncbi:MAG: InlB B-repeat-containing protein, partial [Christensenellales bacterium]
MRKTAKTIVLLTMIFVMAISVGMMAMGCEIGGGGDGNSSSKTIYYQYNDNVKNPNDWICFEKDKWSDSENTGGRLEKNGDKFRAYLTVFGEEDVMFYGTVSNGVLKWTLGESFGMTIYYKYYSDDCTVSNKDSRGIPETGDGTDEGGQQPSEDNRTKYTVTFNSMGGSSVASVEVRDGDRLTAPTQPTKSMSVFSGWYKDIGCISVFDFETERITSNITLYAKWKQEEVRITSCEGATIESNNVINMVVSHDTNRVDMSGKIVINSNDAYWKLYYDELGAQEIPTKLATGKDSTLSEGLNEFYIVVTSADQTQTKLYKLQIYKKYTVTIRVFGLDPVTPMGTRSAVTGDIMPTPNYTIPGYTITGWSCSEARLGEKIPLNAARIINVYARYTPNEYTVTYDANNGSMSEKSVKVTYGKETQFAVPTRVGYTFMGWYRNDNQVTGQNAKGTWNYAGDGTLTAVWRANRYSVKTEANIAEAGTAKVLSDLEEVNVYFDLNGVTTTNGEVAMQTITKTKGLVYPTTPTATGKIFGGWFTDADCTDYFDFSSSLGCDTTLYAKWYSISSSGTIIEPGQSDASYSVSGSTKYLYWLATNSCNYSVYYKNSNSSSNYAIYLKVYDVTDSTTVKNEFKISNTSYSSYTFSATAGHVYRIDYYAYYYNTTLYSYVTQAEATPEGGKVDSANTAIGMYGDRITLQATTNDGYTFVGWYDGGTNIADTPTATITMPASNKTYTAVWTSYTITTNTNMSGAGTYTIKNQTKVTAGKSVTITATTNNGYTWLGWYDGDTKLTGELSYTFTMPASSKTYTAKWSNCPVTLTKNIDEAGSVSGLEGATAVGKSATITATTNNGYTWVGWYDGDTKLTGELSYTFTMPASSKTYTAKWSNCPVTLTKNIDEAGSVSGLEGATAVGKSATITATTNNGYTWVGWYDG